MTITSILSIILVSPILGYSIYLLIQENIDPLSQFHDSFRAKHIHLYSANLSSDSRQERTGLPAPLVNIEGNQEKMLGNPVVLCISLIGFGFMIFIGSTLKMGLFMATFFELGAWLIQSRLNTRGAEAREKAIESEFPAFAELFTILIVAGESPALALIRISESFQGELGKFLRSASLEIQNGRGLQFSLEHLGQTVGSKTIRRFVDALIIAIERGTPLADVLHRQVEDSRRQQQVKITKQAGKAEIALMIPVVFLILPISILFALWPSYLALGQRMF